MPRSKRDEESSVGVRLGKNDRDEDFKEKLVG